MSLSTSTKGYYVPRGSYAAGYDNNYYASTPGFL